MKKILLTLFISLLMSCDESQSPSEDGDYVKSDSTNVGKTIEFMYAKGPMKAWDTDVIIRFPDTTITGKFGDYSRAELVYTPSTVVAKTVVSDDLVLVKSEVIGMSLNEFSGYMVPIDMEAVKVINMRDSVINMETNVIHTLIAIYMDSYGTTETIEGYNSAKKQVLMDLYLDTALAIDYALDGDSTPDEFKGILLATAYGLIEAIDEGIDISIIKYDELLWYSSLLRYPYTIEEKLAEDTTQYVYTYDNAITKMNGYLYNKFLPACSKAQEVMNSDDYRNLVLYKITDDVVNACEEQFKNVIMSRVKEVREDWDIY